MVTPASLVTPTRRVPAVAAYFMAFALGVSYAGPQQDGQPKSFEVASIKAGSARDGIQVNVSGRRFVWENIPLSEAIIAAYRIGSWQISGAPSWVGADRFTIDAVRPEGSIGQKFPFQDDRLMKMIQSLLADRFNLKFHWEAREARVYYLEVATHGPKLKVSTGDDPADPNQRTGMSYRRGLLSGARASMADLTTALSVLLEHPVFDRTGLSGTYDFTVQYSREEEDSLPSLFTALRDNVGLRLQTGTGHSQIFCIDHVEKPEGN